MTSIIKVDQIQSSDGKTVHLKDGELLNINKISTKNLDIQSPEAPDIPVTGQIYYNTTLKAFLVYNGSAWITIHTTTIGGHESFYSEGGTRYKVHTFYKDDTFIPDRAMTVDVFIVAGGGAGGSGWYGGGGGAGGVVYRPGLSITAQSYPIVVGDGGVRSLALNVRGGNGGNSTAFGLTAIGGGGGGSRAGQGGGADGGSGGGPAEQSDSTGSGIQTTDSSISAESRAYGLGNGMSWLDNGENYGGAGGGAGGAGIQPRDGWATQSAYGAPGGMGIREGDTYTINGTSTVLSFNGEKKWFAEGGGGGSADRIPNCRNGVGGQGASSCSNTLAGAGVPGTGSGGGGGTGDESGTYPHEQYVEIGGNGGSGIVIVRYAV